MILNLDIEINTYKVPTEVREIAVQGICDAFLSRNCFTTFHPFKDGPGFGRNRTIYITKWKGTHKYTGFEDGYFLSQGEVDKDYIRINGAEMKAAFQALIKAGYHMFRVYEYGTWMGYKLSERPFMQDAEEVFDFNDFID